MCDLVCQSGHLDGKFLLPQKVLRCEKQLRSMWYWKRLDNTLNERTEAGRRQKNLRNAGTLIEDTRKHRS
jgi:hypothetical protein